MITVKEILIPVVTVDPIDDAEFTPGDKAAWLDSFVAQITASRGNGVYLRGAVYVALDIAQRMYEQQVLPEVGPWNSPLLLETFQTEGVTLYVELALSENEARIE